jgi:hypothetical protein
MVFVNAYTSNDEHGEKNKRAHTYRWAFLLWKSL